MAIRLHTIVDLNQLTILEELFCSRGDVRALILHHSILIIEGEGQCLGVRSERSEASQGTSALVALRQVPPIIDGARDAV